MTQKIKTIHIEAFRGIPEIDIPLDCRSLTIKGDNGTGKSSIVEALEFFFTGRISALEGVQGLSVSQHAPHVNFQRDDTNIVINFDPGDLSLSRSFNQEPNIPPILKQYFDTTNTGTFILKRSQMLGFILCPPAERFRAIASIIGIESFDEAELELKRAKDEIAGEKEAKEISIQSILNKLSQKLEKEINSVDDALPSLNEILEDADLPKIKSLEDVKEHAAEMLKEVKTTKSVEDLNLVNSFLQETENELFFDDFDKRLNTFHIESKKLIEDNIISKLKLSNIMEMGIDLIQAEKLDECPLCEQTIEREDILESITQRLNTLKSLTEKAGEVRKSSSTLRQELEGVKQKISGMYDNLKNIDGIKFASLEDINEKSKITNLIKDIKDMGDLKKINKKDALTSSLDEIRQAWSDSHDEFEKWIKSLGVSDEEVKLLDAVSLVNSTRERVDDLVIEIANKNLLNVELNIANKLYENFSGIKKRIVSEIYAEIEGDIQSFYEIIHPEEDHTDIKLVLSEDRRASTLLRMKSFGRDDEDPRAFTSEGHLDSLGLCIFLAFVKSFNVGCDLIILDDVVTTIDSNHRSRICDLLFDEFSDKQFIITTHDGIWFKELLAFQRAANLGSKFLNLEIEQWNLEEGPKIDKFSPRFERLQERINNSDKVGAGNGGRQYLEWVLKQIILSTNASVPIHAWLDSTVGALTPHSKNRLVTLVIDDVYVDSIEKAFNELEKTVIFGNLLSHDNVLAENASITEIERFVNSIRGIHNLISCNGCEKILMYVKQTNEYRCTNRRCDSKDIYPTK